MTSDLSFYGFTSGTLICTFTHLSQPPVKNMLSSKGWNFKAKTFLPCPDSGAKMSSLLQKKSIGVKIENTPETEQLGHSDLPFACVKRSLSVKTLIWKCVSLACSFPCKSESSWYERLCTMPWFETETHNNLEMAYSEPADKTFI